MNLLLVKEKLNKDYLYNSIKSVFMILNKEGNGMKIWKLISGILSMFLAVVLILDPIVQITLAKEASSLHYEIRQEISENKLMSTIILTFEETEKERIEKVTLPDGKEQSDGLSSISYSVCENGTYEFLVDYIVDNSTKNEKISIEVTSIKEELTNDEDVYTTIINDKTNVETESDLLMAIQNVTGTKNDPAVITVSKDIILSSSISYSEKFILIQGVNPDITISVEDSFMANSSLFNVGASSDEGTLETPTSGLSLKNITIDLKGRGRAIFAVKAEINLLSGCTIQNGYFEKDGGGAVYLSNQAKVNMYSGAILKKNKATGNGGALCIWPDGIFNMYGGTIDGSSANYGSAIWNSGGTVYIEGGTISNNFGNDYGVIGNQGNSTCVIDSQNTNDPVRILENNSSNWRAGIYGNKGSTLFIKGALFQNNQVEQNIQAGAVTWGGLSSDNKGSCEIESCTFIGNSKPAFRLQGPTIFSGNKTDKTQTVAITSNTPLVFTNSIPEGSVLDIYCIRNGILEEGVLVVQGSDNYHLTSDDLEKIDFSTDSEGTYALILDEENNQLKTAKGVTITFNNNIDGEETIITQQVPFDKQTILRTNSFNRDGYVFDGWDTNRDGSGVRYQNRAMITVSSDITLYAQWREIQGTKDDPWDVSAKGENDYVIAYLEQNNGDHENPTYTLTLTGVGAMMDLDVTGVNNANTPQSEWKTDTRPWKNYLNQITKVIVDEGVTYIGKRSLKCAKNLKELILPESLEVIGYQAFHYCSSLEIINSLGSNINTIMQSAFQGTAIETISIPGNVKTIGSYAFFECKNLYSVDLKDGIEKIENQAFAMTAIKSIEIPDSVLSIDKAVFYSCSNLESVVLPKTLNNISNQLFQFSSSLKRILIPNTVTSIGEYAFQKTGLSAVFIPESVTQIGNAAFTRIEEVSGSFTMYFSQEQQLKLLSNVPGAENYSPAKTILAITNGGVFSEHTEFIKDTLAIPFKNGYLFGGWYENASFSGESVINPKSGKIYYAKWIEKKKTILSFKDDLNLDKIYDGNAVFLSEKDYIVTEGAGKVSFIYQMKKDNEWENIGTAPINAGVYQVKAIVEENDTHQSAETDWRKFIIGKADPIYEIPTNLTMIEGQTLAEISLPEGFVWQESLTTPVKEVGTKTFKVTYTPKDIHNYNVIRGIEITLKVNPRIEESKVTENSPETGDNMNRTIWFTLIIISFWLQVVLFKMKRFYGSK